MIPTKSFTRMLVLLATGFSLMPGVNASLHAATGKLVRYEVITNAKLGQDCQSSSLTTNSVPHTNRLVTIEVPETLTDCPDHFGILDVRLDFQVPTETPEIDRIEDTEYYHRIHLKANMEAVLTVSGTYVTTAPTNDLFVAEMADSFTLAQIGGELAKDFWDFAATDSGTNPMPAGAYPLTVTTRCVWNRVTYVKGTGNQPDQAKIHGRGYFLLLDDNGPSEPCAELTVDIVVYYDLGPSTPPLRRPVLIVPGIGGTYAADPSNDTPWLLQRGVPPADLVIDPLTRVYDDLIETLRRAGYKEGEDLWIACYDWRVQPAPFDGRHDGHIDGITASSITDERYEYGVDYLGFWLRQAAEEWNAQNPGQSLDEVDVITHSTGGLVARSYIQSAAYGGLFNTAAGSQRLPKIKNLILVAVPHQGASKVWNLMHDNWSADPAYKYVLSRIVSRAYQHVLDGETIAGPTPSEAITRASILDASSQPDPVRFIRRYVPTLRCLLATYDFIEPESQPGLRANVNADPATANELALDLNANGAPFASYCTATVIYSTGVTTPDHVRTRRGANWGWDPIAPMADVLDRNAHPGEVWYEDVWMPEAGDGTVPTISSFGLFANDTRVKAFRILMDNISHTGLMSNPSVQKQILQLIDAELDSSWISTDRAETVVGNIISVLVDPVDVLLVDAAGRRLGYTQGTGRLAEIGHSVWVGRSEGLGWVFGDIALPARLQLIGRGTPYQVQVRIQQGHQTAGYEWSGALGAGQSLDYPLTFPASTNASLRIKGLRLEGDGNVRIRFETHPGVAAARLETASQPHGPWNAIPTAMLLDTPIGPEFLANRPAGSNQAFYRVVATPGAKPATPALIPSRIR
jgi:hypothetical protein